MPIFTFPLAFIALLAAVPALVAIYWLRNRARERRVSSLLLWLYERQKWEGGQRIQKLQTPLLFFLELLTILLLVMAAAGPVMRANEGGRPLVVVLDDSFSMLADLDPSPRTRAQQAIESELRSNRYDVVRFVLAGETPQLLGEVSHNAGEVSRLLRNWRCGAVTAKMEEAIAFAFEIGGPRSRVLSITDHAPQQEPTNSRLQWWAFGTASRNFGFINAVRSRQDIEDRVLLEIANLSRQPGSTVLAVGSETPQTLTLGPGETRRILLTLNASAPALRAKLGDDVLKIDNEVVLLPEADKTVAVESRIADAEVRALVERAVQSLPNAKPAKDAPDLIITDEQSLNNRNSNAWSLQIIKESDAASYLGPFVIDRAHPLTEGLSLGGVVWGSGRSERFPGPPVIMAGNIPLLTDLNRSRRHELRLRLRPDLSTLQETPNFPILISNLINWRAQSTPGLRQSNVRMGGDAVLTVPDGTDSVKVTGPDRNIRQVPAQENRVSIKAEIQGLYEIDGNQTNYSFAVNALQPAESDLSHAASGRWGNWASAAAFEWEYRRVTWLFLLLAIIVLAIHTWLVRRN